MIKIMGMINKKMCVISYAAVSYSKLDFTSHVFTECNFTSITYQLQVSHINYKCHTLITRGKY